MPNEQRNPLQEFQDAHIPGAVFFDVDKISDQTSNLPHMLPSERAFAAAVSQWRASGYEVETTASGDAILKVMEASDVIEKVYPGQLVALASFITDFQQYLVWYLENFYLFD